MARCMGEGGACPVSRLEPCVSAPIPFEALSPGMQSCPIACRSLPSPPIVAEQTFTPASASLLQSALPGFLRAPWSHELHPASVGLSVHFTHPTHFQPLSSLPQSGCSQAARGQLSWPGLQPPGWLQATASEWLSQPRGISQGLCWPPPAAQMAAGVHRELGSPGLPDICCLPLWELTPGRGAWQETISEVLTSQTHSCFGSPPGCAQGWAAMGTAVTGKGSQCYDLLTTHMCMHMSLGSQPP